MPRRRYALSLPCFTLFMLPLLPRHDIDIADYFTPDAAILMLSLLRLISMRRFLLRHAFSFDYACSPADTLPPPFAAMLVTERTVTPSQYAADSAAFRRHIRQLFLRCCLHYAFDYAIQCAPFRCRAAMFSPLSIFMPLLRFDYLFFRLSLPMPLRCYYDFHAAVFRFATYADAAFMPPFFTLPLIFHAFIIAADVAAAFRRADISSVFFDFRC